MKDTKGTHIKAGDKIKTWTNKVYDVVLVNGELCLAGFKKLSDVNIVPTIVR